jgi:hypothetical protein
MRWKYHDGGRVGPSVAAECGEAATFGSGPLQFRDRIV